jgi:hypothetical protein
MQDYYAYFLDPDGHVQLRVDLLCEDDAIAPAIVAFVAVNTASAGMGDRRGGERC